MNAKKAKLCRKIAYGDNHHKKGRKYGRKDNGQIVASPDRHKYQMIKKVCRGMDGTFFLELGSKLNEGQL